jgi:hypothetical protein
VSVPTEPFERHAIAFVGGKIPPARAGLESQMRRPVGPWMPERDPHATLGVDAQALLRDARTRGRAAQRRAECGLNRAIFAPL